MILVFFQNFLEMALMAGDPVVRTGGVSAFEENVIGRASAQLSKDSNVEV
jgi:hypothetical protein